MNKELREDLEHLIICKDKTITQDLRDDIKMTLDYIDSLENEILEYKSIEKQLLESINEKHNIIDKAIEYIEDNMSYVVKGNKEYIPTGEDLLDILRGEE